MSNIPSAADVPFLPSASGRATNVQDAIQERALVSQVRDRLTANRTYYVRTDGNDNNTGLSNTSGGAFLTLQKAWNTVAALDLSTYAVTIKVADGTYTAGLNIVSMPLGGASITIEGNTGTPANVHIDATTHCFRFKAPAPCDIFIRGFRLSFTGSSINAILVEAPGTVTCSQMVLAGGSTGFAGAYCAAGAGAKLIVSTGQEITGGMSGMAQAIDFGLVRFHGITVTLTGTPAWSWTGVSSTAMGLVAISGVTFSGSATGQRYDVRQGAGISTGGGGANYLPGNSAGNTISPGWYL